ncbi:hypothetical protein L7F22_069304 [Adiantum nelumboides]|nr:hypothetical protein [Adiantum nelumboides]
MKDMALLKRSSSSVGLTRGRVSMNQTSSLTPSSTSSASSSSSRAAAAVASRKGGEIPRRNMEVRFAPHSTYGAGHGDAEAMGQYAVIKGVHKVGNDNGIRNSTCVVMEGSTHTIGAECEGWWDNEEGCSTPKSAECRIPVDACLVCPPAPRKRKAVARFSHTNSPFATLPLSGRSSPPVMILPHFIDSFFTSAEGGSF